MCGNVTPETDTAAEAAPVSFEQANGKTLICIKYKDHQHNDSPHSKGTLTYP